MWLVGIAVLGVVTLMRFAFYQKLFHSGSSLDLADPNPMKVLPVSYEGGDCMLSHKALGMMGRGRGSWNPATNTLMPSTLMPSSEDAALVGLEPNHLLSQGNQDIILGKIFEAIGVKHKQCVEFGKSCVAPFALSLQPSTVSSQC